MYLQFSSGLYTDDTHTHTPRLKYPTAYSIFPLGLLTGLFTVTLKTELLILPPSSLLLWVFPILVNSHFILGMLQTKNLVIILDSSHTSYPIHPDIILALNKIYSESNHLFSLPSVSNDTISLYYSLPTTILALIRTLIASYLTQSKSVFRKAYTVLYDYL